MASCYPQHSEFFLEDLHFFSNFDSGNLLRVVKSGVNIYDLWIAADAHIQGFNNYRNWFHFGVRGLQRGVATKFNLMNLTNIKLFSNPQYRVIYKMIPGRPKYDKISNQGVFEQCFQQHYKYSWVYESDLQDQIVYFSLTVPYPYYEIQRSIDFFQAGTPANAYFYREIIAFTPDNREIELVTITSIENLQTVKEERLPGLFPTSTQRALKGTKPIVFVSSRVHPGETPSSFVLDGLLKAILSNDVRGEMLRQNFIFKIIPALNPDGVARGHFRLDQKGVNLNRVYISPSPIDHPSIYAAKTYLEYLHFRLGYVFMYLDLHAHSSKKGAFLFGNCLDIERQVENQTFAKLLNLNSEYFSFSDCDFSERSMHSKSLHDPCTKEGSGRVANYRSTNLTFCYTVEACYQCNKPLNKLTPLVNSRNNKIQQESYQSSFNFPGILTYNRNIYDDMGQSLAYSILDLVNINPITRIKSTEYRSLQIIKEWVRAKIYAQRIRPAVKKHQSRSEMRSRSKSNIISDGKKDKQRIVKKLGYKRSTNSAGVNCGATYTARFSQRMIIERSKTVVKNGKFY